MADREGAVHGNEGRDTSLAAGWGRETGIAADPLGGEEGPDDSCGGAGCVTAIGGSGDSIDACNSRALTVRACLVLCRLCGCVVMHGVSSWKNASFGHWLGTFSTNESTSSDFGQKKVPRGLGDKVNKDIKIDSI